MKYYTTSKYVDVDTGEIIPKWKVQDKQYIIINIKRTTNANITKEYTSIEITNECRRNQNTLFD